MQKSRFGRQDGFFREIIWLVVIVGVIAIVLLDAMALFNAHQSAHDAASSAVREAQTEFAQSGSVAQAKVAAEQYLKKSGKQLVAFHTTTTSLDSASGFEVTAKSSAKTYAFRYLSYIPGLEHWVAQVTHPTGTETSD